MESRLIYAASDSLKYKVNWLKASDDTEWIYFGAGADVNKQLAIESIYAYFPDPLLYIALTRKDSMQANRNDIDMAIDEILGLKNFLIWDIEFKTVIEFNHIGVMRRGYI